MIGCEQPIIRGGGMATATIDKPVTREAEFEFGSFKLDGGGTLRRGATPIHLPPKELAALRLLLDHAGQVLTPAQIKKALWGDVHVSSDSVPRCLSSLRARIEPDRCIQTIYKRGYRLTLPVHRVGGSSPLSLRLAILPFALGPEIPEHLGAAIAEEVTTRLTESSPTAISVVARDSVFSLARNGLTAVQVGEKVGADLVLTGTLLAMPAHYRLRVEMIRVADGTQIWVEDILVGADRMPTLKCELVQRLVFRLGGEFSLALSTPPSIAGTAPSPEAYENFLRGHQECQWNDRHRIQDGMRRLLHATELDPRLLSAQVDLANVCTLQEFFGFMSPGVASRQIQRVEESVARAEEPAPALLPPLGWMRFHFDRDLPAALDLFSESAHLPHDPWITRLRVMLALSRQRFDEAFGWLDSALLVDPYAAWIHARIAWTHHLAGDAAESVRQVNKCLSLFPDHESGYLYGALILAFNREPERGAQLAETLLRRKPYFDIAASLQAYALACGGLQQEASETLERLQWLSRERFVLPSFNAAAYLALGDRESAMAELRNANQIRCPWFFQMLSDPRLEPLHGDPEFEAMRALLIEMEDTAAEDFEYQYEPASIQVNR